MKTVFSLLLCALLALPFSSTAQGPADGTYTGMAVGFSKTIPIRVSLTYENGVLVAAEAVGAGEHLEYAEQILLDLPAKMVAQNTVEVDSVTGVTFTCNGILAAARDARAQAEQAAAPSNTLGLESRKSYEHTVAGLRWGDSTASVLSLLGQPEARENDDQGGESLRFVARALGRQLPLHLSFRRDLLVSAAFTDIKTEEFSDFAQALTRKYGAPLLLEEGSGEKLPRAYYLSGGTLIRLLPEAEGGLIISYTPFLQSPGEDPGEGI